MDFNAAHAVVTQALKAAEVPLPEAYRKHSELAVDILKALDDADMTVEYKPDA